MLVAAFAASTARRELDDELREVGGRFKELGEAGRRSEQWTTTWWEQFTVLLQRGMKERRHEALSGLRIAQVAASALLAGLLWWRSGDRLQDQVQSQTNPRTFSSSSSSFVGTMFLLMIEPSRSGWSSS